MLLDFTEFQISGFLCIVRIVVGGGGQNNNNNRAAVFVSTIG